MLVVAYFHAYAPQHNAGAEMMAHTMLRELVRRGHTVEAWIPEGNTGDYEYEGVKVIRPRHKSDPLTRCRDADLIVSHLHYTARAKLIAAETSTPLAVIGHNTFPESQRLFSDGVDLIVHNSQWMADTMGLPGIVVRPPVFAAEYAGTAGEHVTAVNLAEIKGPDVFYGLAARFPTTPFLAVCGAYSPQDLRYDVPNVTIIGTVAPQDMRDKVYARTRVLLMPSVYESYGRVGVEALASGIPVVASPNPGVREALGAAGHYPADRTDLDQWAALLAPLLERKGWRAASRRARARSAELDPAAELDAWCTAAVATAERGRGRRG
jgi:hypothetical protein